MAEDLDDAAEPSTSEQLQEDEQEDGLLDPQLTLTFEVQIGKRGDNLRCCISIAGCNSISVLSPFGFLQVLSFMYRDLVAYA